MDLIGEFKQRASGRRLSVVLPEGKDPRVVGAARLLRDQGIAAPIVLGKPEEIAEATRAAGVTLDGIVRGSPNLPALAGSVSAFLRGQPPRDDMCFLLLDIQSSLSPVR